MRSLNLLTYLTSSENTNEANEMEKMFLNTTDSSVGGEEVVLYSVAGLAA